MKQLFAFTTESESDIVKQFLYMNDSEYNTVLLSMNIGKCQWQ